MRPCSGGLTADEEGSLLGYGWFTSAELAACQEPLQPPDLAAIVDQLGGAP